MTWGEEGRLVQSSGVIPASLSYQSLKEGRLCWLRTYLCQHKGLERQGWQSGAAQMCATKISGTDLSKPIGVAAVLPGVRGKISPYPTVVQKQLQTCTGFSIDMLDAYSNAS